MLLPQTARLTALDTPLALEQLAKLQRGIEKESLRIAPDGKLSTQPHPKAFGSALSHPRITTDFSEALMELITPVHTGIDSCLEELSDIHRYVYQNLENELLWTASMPCILGDDEAIPVAQFGSSNTAKMKSIYRVGLGHRYGRRMQTIAGIHYNFSIPKALWPLLQDSDRDFNAAYRKEHGEDCSQEDYQTAAYFGLIRNFRRYSWLLLYLFGAAPAVCGSFLAGQEHKLEKLDEHSLYLPHSTSLRMGDLGYQSNAQQSLKVCYNLLDNYIATLSEAITTSHPDYEKIGVQNNGDYKQLSTALLQIENEFYSPIRPKRVTDSGEIPLGALKRSGVEYVEVRCIDVNPFEPTGISSEQVHFLDAFLLFCLIAPSPACDDQTYQEIGENQAKVVNRGREPGLQLADRGKQRSLQNWAEELMQGVASTARLLDKANQSDRYSAAYGEALKSLENPENTPAARLISEMRESGMGFHEFTMSLAQQHQQHFVDTPLAPEKLAKFEQQSAQSFVDQTAIEAEQTGSFEQYLADFYAQYDQL